MLHRISSFVNKQNLRLVPDSKSKKIRICNTFYVYNVIHVNVAEAKNVKKYILNGFFFSTVSNIYKKVNRMKQSSRKQNDSI
jgi:hypothetical protein